MSTFEEIKDRVFLHRINLDDWLPCHNLRLTRFIVSSNLMNKVAYQNEKYEGIEKCSINNLKMGITPSGILQPRFGNLCERFFKEGKEDKLDIEASFESGRRMYNNNAPCRLTCLYAVEDSEVGRLVISEMFSNPGYIMKVKIDHLENIFRADFRWFDEYAKDGKDIFIKKYWSGESFDKKNERWEYLIDGVIKFIDEDELNFLREFSINIKKV